MEADVYTNKGIVECEIEPVSNIIDEIEKECEEKIMKVNHDMFQIQEEFRKNMKEMETRLENIQEYNKKLIENQRQRHLMQVAYLKEKLHISEKLYKCSMIANIIFCAIIVVFMIGIITFSNKYHTLVDQYVNISEHYNEIDDKYDELITKLNDMIENSNST